MNAVIFALQFMQDQCGGNIKELKQSEQLIVKKAIEELEPPPF